DMPATLSHSSLPGLQVRYAAANQTADDAIVAFLTARREPGQYAVVTNDRELAFRARSAGANVISASTFAVRLEPPPRKVVAPPDAGPDPHDPAFADIYAEFMHTDSNKTRARPTASANVEIWLERLYGDDAAAAQEAARWLGNY